MNQPKIIHYDGVELYVEWSKYIKSPTKDKKLWLGKWSPINYTITIDTRIQNVHQRLGLGTKTRLYWGDENIYEAQELSCFLWPIVYRVITRSGYYNDDNGEVVHFTTKAYGIDSRRHVSEVLMRASMFLLVIAGMGYLQWRKKNRKKNPINSPTPVDSIALFFVMASKKRRPIL